MIYYRYGELVMNSKFDEYYSAFLDIEKAVKINNMWYIRNIQ